jgi:lipopolysaccharide export system protein LptA
MRIIVWALAATLALAAAPSALAQEFGAAFAGFDTGSDQPIQIEADRLEVRDPEKLAIYTGNVSVSQGGTILEAPELRVFYTGSPSEAGSPGSQVSRIEAGPKVVVRSSDQTASGERVVLDMAKDLVTLTGNVVLTQGPNVVRGERLVVNLKSKEGRMEGGRVQTLITPSGSRPPSQ